MTKTVAASGKNEEMSVRRGSQFLDKGHLKTDLMLVGSIRVHDPDGQVFTDPADVSDTPVWQCRNSGGSVHLPGGQLHSGTGIAIRIHHPYLRKPFVWRSEEHTSELQSRLHLV